MDYEELKDTIKRHGDVKVDLNTHKVTEAELNNIAYLAFRYLGHWQMRSIDFLVVQRLMIRDVESTTDVDEVFCPALAEYIWDHILGEPDYPTRESVLVRCCLYAQLIWRMNAAVRNTV